MEPSDLSLTRLEIKNFKSIQRIELDRLEPLVLLMGRNNAGKSNFLDACKFLADAAVSFEQALAERGGDVLEVMHRKKAEEPVELIFDFSLAPAAVPKRAEWMDRLFAGNKFMTAIAAVGSPFLSAFRLRVTLAPGEFTEELFTTNLAGSDWFKIFSIKGTPEATDVVSGQMESLCKRSSGALPAEPLALEASPTGVFRLRLGAPDGNENQPVSQEVAEMVRQQFTGLEWIDPLRKLPAAAPILGEHTLAHDASNLPDVLHWLYNNKPKVFRRIEAEVGKLVPQLGRLYTPTFQNAATLGMMDRSDEELVFSMNQLSYGTRSLVAIVSKVILARGGAWVCIEEPETYLHPQAQMALFQFLREEARTKRLFVTTHSTAIAASCPLRSLFVIERDANNCTVATPVWPENTGQIIEQLGVKPSFSFEADAIVFVEDATTLAALEALARQFSFRAKTQFLPAEGADTLHYHANARVAVSKFVHTLVFAVFGPGGPAVRKKMIDQLKLPPEQVLVLEAAIEATGGLSPEIRGFFEKIETAAKPYWRI